MLYGEKKQEVNLSNYTGGKLLTIQMIIMIYCFVCMPAITTHAGDIILKKDKSNTGLIYLIDAGNPQSIREDSTEPGQSPSTSGIHARFSEFPNLHSLFVHFPIVSFLLAYFIQLTSFFIYREPLSYVTMALLAAGFAGAILAAKVYHPHISEGLPDRMVEIFETHEQYANIIFSVITLNKNNKGYDREKCRIPACVPPLIFI